MNSKIIFQLVIIFLVSVKSFAQEPIKRLYLGNDTHTDLMWNGDEDFWYDMSLKMAEFYLKLGEGSADNPGDLVKFLVTNSEVYGFIFTEHWYDVGTYKSLKEADEAYMKRGVNRNEN